MRVLYITYDGLTDFIGQSQVLPYLLGCAEAGHQLTVISFEKRARENGLGEDVQRRCVAAGVEWLPQRFRSSPPIIAKAIDLRSMGKAARGAAKSGKFDLVHCRSYPAASVGLGLKRRYGLPLLFDMRGFWPDQRREGGRWRDDSLLGRSLFRRWKKIEAALIANADHIVVLTEAARRTIKGWPDYRGAPISVVPCCADFDLFRLPGEAGRATARTELGIMPDAPLLVYLGSLGTVYRLDAILELFASARTRLDGLKILFIGRDGGDLVFREAERLGISLSADEVRFVAAERPQVPYWLGAGDIGLCFCTPTFSSLGVSLTKVGEYLACGLPIVGNTQIGDFEEIIEAVGSGTVLQGFSQTSIDRASASMADLLGVDRTKIREQASRFLDLNKGIAAYRTIYADVDQAVTLEP
jgi:glycosyltransferase involved in cell wall biosynthesis